MSSSSTLVSAAHFAYVADHAQPEGEFLQSLKSAAGEAGIPEICIAPEQVAFLSVLLKLSRAQQVVEVGTLAGYSAIGMARALPPGGRVHTIEFNPKHAAFAREWIAKSDVAERIEVLEGRGDEHLPNFAAASIDAVFLDADKSGYPQYLREAMRFLKPGGLVMADNAFAFGQLLDPNPTDREVQAVRDFNDHVPTVPGLEAVIVPIGDGLWVGIKH